MQFFVFCKRTGHTAQRVYVRFEKEPQVRAEIPFFIFQMTCDQGHTETYNRGDIKAEVGLEPIGGAILGGILFLVDPLLGAIGAGAGLFGIARLEQEKVERFNASVG